MSFNLHTHTFRCHHASGSDEDYVIEAIKNGYTVIGFSDHAPYVFPKGHRSSFRMETEATQGYAQSIMSLREKYKDRIDIKLGFEVEWYPQFIEKELNYLKSFGYDFIICGQHYTGSEVEPWARYTGHETNDISTLDKYIHQVLLAALSGEFAYIAHPDLINFTGDRQIYIEKMGYMLKELKALDVPIEFNFLGFTDRRNYPNDDFWKLAAAEGNRVAIGLDAHHPEVYSDTERLNELKIKIASFGIKPIENVYEILK